MIKAYCPYRLLAVFMFASLLGSGYAFTQPACSPTSTTLCLQNGRFKVTLNYTNGSTSAAQAVALTNESGTFWFFNSQNAEVLVKVLDGTAINGKYWVYHSPMTHLAYSLTVTDQVTGISQTYTKAVNSFCGDGDTSTFAANPNLSAPTLEDVRTLTDQPNPNKALTPCLPSNQSICLQSGRFTVTVDYVDPNSGQTLAAKSFGYGDQTGFFSFFSNPNLEIGVKVLDALQGSGYYWVYISGATHVNYTVKITDTLLGVVKTYPTAGAYCGQSDTQAFGNPVIRLQQGATVINRNGTLNLGNTAYNQPLQKTFTVYNDGNGPLALSQLTWDGSEISLVSAPPTSIPKGGNGSFTLAFGATSSGNLTREIRLTTTDLGANPFRFNASWTVAAPIGPVIQLLQAGAVINQGQTVDFGTTGVAQPLNRQFTVKNVGDQPLTVAQIVITANANDPSKFTVSQSQLNNILPGQSGSFTLTFDAAAIGTVTILAHLFQNGSSAFDFQARGTVLPADFNLSMGPSSRTVDPGQNAFYTVDVNGLYGFNQNVALNITGLPAGISAQFTPTTIAPGTSSQLRLSPTAAAAPGTYPFTVTGTANGLTRTTGASLILNDSSDFNLAATPGQRIITQGASTTYALSATGLNGFNGSIALSLSGLPTAVTQSFAPTSITPGQSSTLTLTTSAQTPVGNHTLTLLGSSGARTHSVTVTLTVNEASTSEPVITAINPDHLQGGVITTITVSGLNLQGASVEVADEPAAPGDPIPSAFPLVSVGNIAANGTSMTLSVDARNPQVSGFYTLVITTPGGTSGAVIRVLTQGPQIDAWSPSEPTRGKTYQLLIMGENLRNAEVTTNLNGAEIFVIGSSNTQLNGFMLLNDTVPVGNTQLIVTKNGVSVNLPIVVQASGSTLMVDHDLFGDQAEQAAQTGTVVPEVYFQDLAFSPELAVAQSDSRTKGLCFVSLGWSIYSYNYTVLIPFDPVTGKIDTNLLRGLGLGETLPAGVKVFSAFVDLYLEVQFQCFPVSHIQVCVYGNVGAEIPGIAGVILSAGGCFFGGAFIPWLTTTGHIGQFNFSTANSCAATEQVTSPGEGGNQRANVTLNQCCESSLNVSLFGSSFSEVPYYSWDFSAANKPISPITPEQPCTSCNCPAIHGTSPLVHDATQVAPPASTKVGKVQFMGSPAALAKYRIIPEELSTASPIFTPVNGMVYLADGFLVDMGLDCGKLWFKVGGGYSVKIIANEASPSAFSGYYDYSVIGAIFGAQEWRNGDICPVEKNFHLALMDNPFPKPGCKPSAATCDMSRVALYAPNLFANPSFEDGSLAPFQSGVDRGSLTIETDPQHVRSGDLALRHQATGDPGTWSPTQPWNGTNQVDFTLSASDTYRFSTWAKASAANTQVRIFIFAKDATGATSAPYYTSKSFTLGSDWQELSLTHTMQPGYQYVSLRVDVKAPGIVWWDDFRFDALDNLADNPGFEQPVKSEGGIFAYAQNGILSMDKTVAHKGNTALKHEAGQADSYTQAYLGSDAAGLTQIQTGEEAYRLTVWARADVNTPIQLRIFGLDGTYNAVENRKTDAIATPTWTEYSVNLTPSEAAEFISIRLDNDGGNGAIVWWDDLVLERLIP